MVARAHIESTIEDVRRWIMNKPGPAFIYCDGGNKPKEFNLYAPILRVGDYIAAHDWDYGGYRRAEIRPKDVAKPVAQHNLTAVGFTEPIRICLYRKAH